LIMTGAFLFCLLTARCHMHQAFRSIAITMTIYWCANADKIASGVGIILEHHDVMIAPMRVEQLRQLRYRCRGRPWPFGRPIGDGLSALAASSGAKVFLEGVVTTHRFSLINARV
jgi:hypothetical protein